MSSPDPARPPLKLVVYDRTCVTGYPWPGLSRYWGAGARLYRGLGRVDGSHAVTSWADALNRLIDCEPGRSIAEVQFWGHGKWGEARIGAEVLNLRTLLHTDPLATRIDRLRARLASDSALFWFRTCETFGALPGQAFARAFSERLGCRAAGHTYIIGYWQSGLHSIEPGGLPAWPSDEGLRHGSPAAPESARASSRRAPNTITCLDGRVPQGF